ncbi:MAG: FAD-dependent thymidylate synthase [Oscillospiraceae bacterium]|nr:FAD-dependent thymidylate synthase [Oscillospiraceae bacterium]
MKVTLLDRPDPTVCATAAGMCYNAKDPWKALLNAMAGGHESVLEHCKFSFMIEGVSRALLAQLTRHRIASFSVQSQRYVSYKDGFDYVTPPAILALGADAEKRYHNQMEMMHMWYCEWLQNDVTPEDARFVLPNACATKLVVTMNARELRHFFSLRCCNRAQWEIREMADEMLRICKENAYSLFADAGPGCVRGACPEGKHSCGKPRNKEQVSV